MSYTIDAIDYERDIIDLKSFLSAKDCMRLDQCRTAVTSGDVLAHVARRDNKTIGWAVMHLEANGELWDSQGNTFKFISDGKVYLENIEIEKTFRNTGVGSKLLETIEAEVKKRGKNFVWLYTSKSNISARRFYERYGWKHKNTIHPEWNDNKPTYLYLKKV